VNGKYALTAFHSVSDGEDRKTVHSPVLLCFRDGDVPATFVHGDPVADFAVLQLEAPLPANAQAVTLTAGCFEGDWWHAVGYPQSADTSEIPLDGYAVSGRVTDLDRRLGTAAAIQAHCVQSAAGFPLHGISGAPVMVGRPRRAVGVVRWNFVDAPSNLVVGGGDIFVCPIDTIVQSFPALADLVLQPSGPEPELDRAAERALMSELPLASNGALGKRRSYVLVLVLVLLAVVLLGGTGTAAAIGILPIGGGSESQAEAPHRGGDASAAPLPATRTATPATPDPTPAPTPPPLVSTPTRQQPAPGQPTPGQRTPGQPAPGQQPVQPAACAASISISPSSGPVDTMIKVFGTCFQPGETVVITFHTTVISQPVASSSGAFTTQGTVPQQYSRFTGQFRVTASGKQSVRWDAQPFELTAT
jgi:hypothetical protein